MNKGSWIDRFSREPFSAFVHQSCTITLCNFNFLYAWIHRISSRGFMLAAVAVDRRDYHEKL